jgi:hypothetical protein
MLKSPKTFHRNTQQPDTILLEMAGGESTIS